MPSRIFLVIAFVLSGLGLAGCGGGVGIDSNGNVAIIGYVNIPPVYGSPVVTPAPGQTFPVSCIVKEYGNTYTLYGAGYSGCPQLTGRDLVSLFQAVYPSIWVDSWTYPSFGTARIIIP